MRKRGRVFSGVNGFYTATNLENKVGEKWLVPGIINVCFGDYYALVHFRGSYFEDGRGDMRSANSLLGIIGRGGAVALRIPHTESPIRYLVGSETLVS